MDEVDYITPTGWPMNRREFTYEYISNLRDPLEYLMRRFDLYHHLNYFYERGFDIQSIKIMQEDNIRTLPMSPMEQTDLMQMGQLLRQYYIEPTEYIEPTDYIEPETIAG